jgi:hypothetical protein
MEHPAGVAPPGRSPGSVHPLGTNTRAVVVAYTSKKNVAIGCLTIHDRSGETSAPPTSAAGTTMIGAPLDSATMRRHRRVIHDPASTGHHRLRPVDDLQPRDEGGGIVPDRWD